MAIKLEDFLKTLPKEQQKAIQERAAELVAEEMTLQQLRRARQRTQVQLAKELGMTQDSVSRLEKRSDVLLSTLRKTVKAMGGELSLVVEFPDQKPVRLSGFTQDDSPSNAHSQKRRKSA